MTKRRLLRVISADWDEVLAESSAFDFDPVQVWVLLPQLYGRRAFLTPGGKLLTRQSKSVTPENAMSLVGERFWVTLPQDPELEEHHHDWLDFLTVESAPFVDDLRLLGLRKP